MALTEVNTLADAKALSFPLEDAILVKDTNKRYRAVPILDVNGTAVKTDNASYMLQEIVKDSDVLVEGIGGTSLAGIEYDETKKRLKQTETPSGDADEDLQLMIHSDIEKLGIERYELEISIADIPTGSATYGYKTAQAAPGEKWGIILHSPNAASTEVYLAFYGNNNDASSGESIDAIGASNYYDSAWTYGNEIKALFYTRVPIGRADRTTNDQKTRLNIRGFMTVTAQSGYLYFVRFQNSSINSLKLIVTKFTPINTL
ncbi:hypothetical protein [Vibrio phage BONAISHI]|nr:hypothetical protein [Vibrio phage BONAISHI]